MLLVCVLIRIPVTTFYRYDRGGEVEGDEGSRMIKNQIEREGKGE